ncbi:hypothetical protein, conserved [Babesia bigemina]|uniref:Transcription factor IIIC subunit 5 HTH domain-containing protein n=1 Tax=Babesia bigemina TaxID=5866 RepID=A0A061DCN3_BABBI|nr:hypothetical protein, conserved [Babesia bigemina]CDR95675.1 hypothetical protein, conserved [Babesia bigemina]|eukprot:XP_012767861.1 hypothetical protein, conserved [Babesia bigemina]
MGKVSSIFTFNQPADFLHIANLPVVTDEEGASNVLNQGYELLPPFFTKTAYIANIFKDTLKNSSSSKKGLKERTSHMLNPVAHFDDAEIPTKPLESTLHASLDRDLIMELKKLFTKRKVWLRTAMDEYLATRFSSWKKKNAFARICYIFAGLSTLTTPNHATQIIDFRDPYYRTISWKTEKQTTGREGSGAQSMPMPLDEIYAEAVKSMPNFNPEVHFLAPPSRPSQLYQLCDIFDAGIQKLINNTSIEMEVNTTDTCSKATGECWPSPIMKNAGWYTQAVMSKIRDMMNVKSLRMRQMQTASSLVQ